MGGQALRSGEEVRGGGEAQKEGGFGIFRVEAVRETATGNGGRDGQKVRGRRGQGAAAKVLIELERCQSMEEGLAKCSLALDVSKEAAEYCESLRAELNERIVVLAKERDEALRAAGDAGAGGTKACEL